MIGASRLSGDTLIACHFPVVQLPTWQLPVQALCSSAKRTQCSAGLTRAVSLPEQDLLNREHAFTGGKRNFSCSYGSLTEDRVEEEGASDSTLSPEETSSHLKNDPSDEKVCQRLHNSFRPNAALDEDDEDEDSDGDNLHRYREDSSFVLHGNLNWPLSKGVTSYAVVNRDGDCEWTNEGTMLSTDSIQHWNQQHPTNTDLLNRCDITMTARVEQDSGTLADSLTSCKHSQLRCSPDVLSNSHTECVSDSSCNSSDGILVNFCTIYNKSNNPETPRDLSSPCVHPSEGSVFLNLQPIAPSLTDDSPIDDSAVCSHSRDKEDIKPPSSWCSPKSIDSNSDFYSLEPLPRGLSSLEVSDLTTCLQNHGTLAMDTNQKYYKLVNCDLSSQSPSPAWSSTASCTEGQSRSPMEEEHHAHVRKDKEDLHTELRLSSTQTTDYQVASTSLNKAPCRAKQTNDIQNIYNMPCSLCPSRCSPPCSQCQNACTASTRPSVVQDGECSHADATQDKKPDGVCPLRYSKAQRPTSLPIQPFVLVPSGQPQTQAQPLGGLLEQYINLKSNKTASSQPGLKSREKSSHLASDTPPSSMRSLFSVILEAPSSSDTCSTCTPSPECFNRRYTWSQPGQNRRYLSPDTSRRSPNPRPSNCKPIIAQRQNELAENLSPCSDKTQSKSLFPAPKHSTLVKIPTYMDLINLTPLQKYTFAEAESPLTSIKYPIYHSLSSGTPPTLPLTTDTHQPNKQVSQTPPVVPLSQLKCQQHRAACAADSSILHSPTPLSSGLQNQDSAGPNMKPAQSHHNGSLMLSDRPSEFSSSSDTSYESMSISDLQRRGLLRSVSRAVDLIMAHFGSSRDPEVKMRLGNSSCSPTIVGLVLEHLCPAIQNILEDGLRGHNLDFIIGQRRNHSWNVVEVSTRIGPSTRVLQSLVFKIKQCAQLTSPCMRLRAFLMGLLNLRALEFWLSLLHSQKDVVTAHYQSWGFLFMSLSHCQPLFEELLLLLQPLTVLPFDLNLLLEPRLLHDAQLRSNKDSVVLLQPCSALLATSWPRLQADRKLAAAYKSQAGWSSPLTCDPESFKSTDFELCKQQGAVFQTSRKSPLLAPIPEWWPKEADVEASVFERVDSRKNWVQMSLDSRHEMSKEDDSTELSIPGLTGSPSHHWLRWAKLFGAGNTLSRAEMTPHSLTEAHSSRNTRPSQWLHLDKSQLGLLAKSIRSLGTRGASTGKHT